MRGKAEFLEILRIPLRVIASIFFTFISVFSIIPSTTQAAAATSITPTPGAGDLNTTITQNGNIYNITNGTRAETNVFHSFGDFSIGSGDIANFKNTPINGSLPLTSNILARVTGGDISNIYGTIQATGFGNANLFLMNPAGFLFGANATVNVGGMVAFTSADYLRLTDGARFNAIPNATTDALLTTAPVAAFGFIGSNPGPITVQGGRLSVTPGESISLVGGNITVQSGVLDDAITGQRARLIASGGQINLASVASSGEILFPHLQNAPNVHGQSFTTMGSITLSEGSILDVSADAAGTVSIRGGQLVIADGTISTDTINANGAPTAVDISITENLSISDTRNGPAITARTTGSGEAGDVSIAAANFQAVSTSDSQEPNNLIDTHTSSSGRAGGVNISTGDLQASSINPLFNFIETGTTGDGKGGDVTITAAHVQLQNTTIDTGDAFARSLFQVASGSAGNLTIIADNLRLNNAALVTGAFSAFADSQQAGDITLNVRDINMNGGGISAIGVARGGAISVAADQLITDFTIFETITVSDPGGGIIINANVVEMTNASSLISTTTGDGHAGDIHVTATDHLNLSGTGPFSAERPTGFFSNSTGDFGSVGDAGSVVVTTPRLEMTGGARINTSTVSSGRGGDVTLSVTGGISISGELPIDEPEPIFGIGSIHPSGVFTKTAGSDLCVGPCGNAGNIAITAGSLILGNGAQIDSGTNNSGRGGNISIRATDTIAMSGTLTDGSPVGIFSRTIGTASDSEAGGNITLIAGQLVTISDGASVSASSTGPGNAGNISINAGQQLEMRDSSITTQATKASGGNINIQAIDRVRLVNSPISTSVRSGPGSGGNITIDPNVVVLQNSPITAQADRGAGGNITITTPLFLADSTSPVNASSQFGRNGTVTIQSPTSNLSESLGTLPSEPNQSQSLVTQRCAALANGQTSSFVVAGREQLPADPGGWLTSSLAFAALGESLDTGHAVASAPAIMPIAADDIGTVSLRRLTPARFLMANFADSEAPGCRS